MNSDREFLALCDRLAGAGMRFPLEPGCVVARGFADLGYEEFLLIGAGKLVSLQTGKPGEIPEAHRVMFFAVPQIDQLVDELARRGWTVAGAEFENGRSWRWRAESALRAIEGCDASHEKALIKLALTACEVANVQPSTGH